MDIESQFVRLIGMAPSLAVLAIGGILCLFRYWRNPRACALTGVAVAIQLGMILIFPLVMNFLLSAVLQPLEGKTAQLTYTVIYSIPDAVSWGLIFWAIFGRDGFAAEAQPPWDDDFPTHRDKKALEPR